MPTSGCYLGVPLLGKDNEVVGLLGVDTIQQVGEEGEAGCPLFALPFRNLYLSNVLPALLYPDGNFELCCILGCA